ncbi:MAG: HRDC domain-containing protein [Sedimentisphaerales bacterium]|nr:HRDC domain-containing protein [Sedimentisphaerales bacterium]
MKPPFRYIDNNKSLSKVVHLLKDTSRICLDTEADSFHHYYPKVCLIQLTALGKNVIIDPLASLDLGSFLDLLSQKVLIFHDAGYDLRMMRSSFGFVPGNRIIDTMVAARLLGYERFGLIAMLEQVLGISMSKKGQKSDWSRRPLTQAQLDYAIEDTRHLERLADILIQKLETLGRISWHQESCEWVIRAAMEPPKEKIAESWRIKGTRSLSPQELAYVRSIWHWCQEEAKEADLPPFRIMGDSAILELARWAVQHPGQSLEEGPKLPRHCKNRRFHKLNATIQKARILPQSKWPGPKEYKQCPSKVLEVRPLTDTLVAVCRKIAGQLHIEPSVLASRTCLERIAMARPLTREDLMQSGPLMQWQANLLHHPIRNVLSR